MNNKSIKNQRRIKEFFYLKHSLLQSFLNYSEKSIFILDKLHNSINNRQLCDYDSFFNTEVAVVKNILYFSNEGEKNDLSLNEIELSSNYSSIKVSDDELISNLSNNKIDLKYDLGQNLIFSITKISKENEFSLFNKIKHNVNNLNEKIHEKRTKFDQIKPLISNCENYSNGNYSLINPLLNANFEERTEISDSNHNLSSSKKRSRYKMFTTQFKCFVIEYSSKYGINETSLKFNVPVKSLKRWVKVGPERQKGGGRKVKDPNMEEKLIKWIKQKFSENPSFCPSHEEVKSKALELSNDSSFLASKGWCEKFKIKYNLKLYSANTNKVSKKPQKNKE